MITIDSMERIPVIRVEGRLDHKMAPELMKALEESWRQGGLTTVIDCTNLVYVSSAGLQVLLLAGKTVESKGGKLAFAALEPFVREVFAMTQFTRIFAVFSTVEEAVAGLSNIE